MTGVTLDDLGDDIAHVIDQLGAALPAGYLHTRQDADVWVSALKIIAVCSQLKSIWTGHWPCRWDCAPRRNLALLWGR